MCVYVCLLICGLKIILQLGFHNTVAMVTMVEIDVYLHRNRGIEQLREENEKQGEKESWRDGDGAWGCRYSCQTEP